MEAKKQEILSAYFEGKTIQSNHSGEWQDFVPQNQVDRPNLDYGTLENWRIKPSLTEDKVSFETAKLAKEKGFNEVCSSHFEENGGAYDSYGWPFRPNDEQPHEILFARPNQSVLQRWLREVHDIQVIVIPFASDSTNENSITVYCFDINKKHFYAFVNKNYEEEYNTYEEALEIGLQEGLKLI